MASNLRGYVDNLLGSRKAEMEKKVYKYDTFLSELEKDIDYGRIKSVSEAMTKIRGKFSYHLTNDDYRSIERELGYTIK